MVEYTPKPLCYWLDKSQNEINQVLEKGTKEPDKEKLSNFYQQYFKSIQLDISQRNSCLTLYINLIDSRDDFFEIQDPLKYKIQINNERFKYHEVRHQLLIPLLSLNTRIYEQCISLCYFLDNPQQPKSFYRLSEVFLKDFPKKFTKREYESIINELKYEYGYCLSIILFFRNQFLHSGEYLNKERNLFMSDRGKDKDILNLKVIEKAYIEYKNKYIKTISFSKKYFDLSEKIEHKAGKIVKQCMDISDHYMGSLINKILQLRWIKPLIKQKSYSW